MEELDSETVLKQFDILNLVNYLLTACVQYLLLDSLTDWQFGNLAQP